MLIEFYGRNFGCFRDEFRLSMLATDIEPGSDRGVVEVRVEGDDEPLRLLRAAALYGPNASGKSTIIRAASALRYLLQVTPFLPSDAPLPPYEPFALDFHVDQPVELGMKALIQGRVYEYCVRFTNTAILSEKLVQLSGEEPVELVNREGGHTEGSWTSDSQFDLIRESYRDNVLLLALADRLVPKLAKLIAVGFAALLRSNAPDGGSPFTSGHPYGVARRISRDSRFREWLLNRLRDVDFGVVDFQTEEMREEAQRPRSIEDEFDGSHESTEILLTRLSLMHDGPAGPVLLPYYRESLGTQRVVQLSALLFDLAHENRPIAAFVDEFDASMHPHLIQALVRHLNCEGLPGQSRGQLVFATHETTLMDRDPLSVDAPEQAVLRRDQVYFTEKSTAGASRLYSLAQFRERNNLNIRKRYLQGRYGALPSLGSLSEA